MKKLINILLQVVLPLYLQGRLFAVFVGVSEYILSFNNLSYCHRDTIEMFELLKEHTPANRMRLLTDRKIPVMWVNFDRNMIIHRRQSC